MPLVSAVLETDTTIKGSSHPYTDVIVSADRKQIGDKRSICVKQDSHPTRKKRFVIACLFCMNMSFVPASFLRLVNQ